MAVIYTVSHPITDQVVYVGCTKSLKMRLASHVNSNSKYELGVWINQLKQNWMLPKIEAIDICDEDDKLSLEKFWIQVLTGWGFKLFNKNKTYNIKKYQPGYYHKSKFSKKWKDSDFYIGKTHRIKKDKRPIFVIYFRQKAKTLGLDDRCLRFAEDGEFLIAEVIFKKDKVFKYDHLTKSGAKAYYKCNPLPPKPKKIPKFKRYKFSKMEIGDSVTLPLSKLISFRNNAGQINKEIEQKKFYNIQRNADGNTFTATIVEEADYIKTGKFTENRIEYILLSKKPAIDICDELKISQSTVSNIRNLKTSASKIVYEKLKLNNRVA